MTGQPPVPPQAAADRAFELWCSGVEIHPLDVPDLREAWHAAWKAAAPFLATAAAAERERDWRNCEQIDFYLTAATGDDGVTWIWLKCSACGPVQASAQGETSDLGTLSVAAQSHLERKHADLLDGTAGEPGAAPYAAGQRDARKSIWPLVARWREAADRLASTDAAVSSNYYDNATELENLLIGDGTAGEPGGDTT